MLACGLAAALIPLTCGLIPGDEPARLERLVLGYALAGLPFLYVWRRWPDLGADRRALVALLAVAAAGRIALLALPPLLSEDLWRYLWDGAVQWRGLDPYRFAPADPALDALATDPALADIRGRIGHGHIPTIYPPAAQALFAAATAFGPSQLALRAVLALLDVAVVAGIWRWAEARGRRPQVAALYGLAPLPMLETAVGGHVDVLGVAGVVLAGALLAGSGSGRAIGAGFGLAVAIWTKLAPVLALPTLLRTRPRAAAATVGAAALLLLPYLTSGGHLLAGLRAYGQRWRANDGLFAALMWPFEQVWPPGREPVELPAWGAEAVRALVGPAPGALPGQVWPDEVAFAAAKLVAGGLFGLVCLWSWWRLRGLDRALGAMLTGLFLVSPVVHPWYLLWLLPLAAMCLESKAIWPRAVIAWSLTAWIAYLPRAEYLRSGDWLDSPAWRAVEYAPVWALLAWGAWRALRR